VRALIRCKVVAASTAHTETVPSRLPAANMLPQELKDMDVIGPSWNWRSYRFLYLRTGRTGGGMVNKGAVLHWQASGPSANHGTSGPQRLQRQHNSGARSWPEFSSTQLSSALQQHYFEDAPAAALHANQAFLAGKSLRKA
jgi:hypothetical protein